MDKDQLKRPTKLSSETELLCNKARSVLPESVTFVIKTIEREGSLRDLLDSIQGYYPDVPTIVLNDGKAAIDWSNNYENTAFINTEYDIGLSEGRNRAIDLVETPYFVLLDDDYVFTEQTRIEILLASVMKTDYDIVAGIWQNRKRDRTYSPKLFTPKTIIEENGLLYSRVLLEAPDRFGNRKSELTANFFICPTSFVQGNGILRYDSRMKIGGEHLDFFYRAKKEGVNCAINSTVVIKHHKIFTSGYLPLRNRQDDGRRVFRNKWGVTFANSFWGDK